MPDVIQCQWQETSEKLVFQGSLERFSMQPLRDFWSPDPL